MTLDVALREMTPDDGPAIEALTRLCPDTGRILSTARYHVDAYRAILALRPETIGLMAELPGGGPLVATQLMSFGRCVHAGAVVPYALFHSLMVHPAHRRKGLAVKMIGAAMEVTLARLGPGGIVVTNVQHSNARSFSALRTFFPAFEATLSSGAIPPRRRPPPPLAGISVRDATPEDLPFVAGALNEFYRDHDLHVPQTAEALHGWLHRSPFDDPFRHYRVAVARDGRIVAGLAVVDQARLRSLVVERMPTLMRLANRVVRIVPPDGVLMQAMVEKAWFSPGYVGAGNQLWEATRWALRDRCNPVVCFFDPRDRLREMFRLPPWLPKATIAVSVRGPARSDRLLCPLM